MLSFILTFLLCFDQRFSLRHSIPFKLTHLALYCTTHHRTELGAVWRLSVWSVSVKFSPPQCKCCLYTIWPSQSVTIDPPSAFSALHWTTQVRTETPRRRSRPLHRQLRLLSRLQSLTHPKSGAVNTAICPPLTTARHCKPTAYTTFTSDGDPLNDKWLHHWQSHLAFFRCPSSAFFCLFSSYIIVNFQVLKLHFTSTEV